MGNPVYFEASYRAMAARTEGAAACRRSAPASENPYVEDTDFYLHSAWILGYRAAEGQRRAQPQDTKAA